MIISSTKVTFHDLYMTLKIDLLRSQVFKLFIVWNSTVIFCHQASVFWSSQRLEQSLPWILMVQLPLNEQDDICGWFCCLSANLQFCFFFVWFTHWFQLERGDCGSVSVECTHEWRARTHLSIVLTLTGLLFRLEPCSYVNLPGSIQFNPALKTGICRLASAGTSAFIARLVRPSMDYKLLVQNPGQEMQCF